MKKLLYTAAQIRQLLRETAGKALIVDTSIGVQNIVKGVYRHLLIMGRDGVYHRVHPKHVRGIVGTITL